MERTRTHRQWSPLARALLATGDQWALLIVLALADGPLRLKTLKDQLTGVSTGVLEDHVRQMVELGVLSRERFREVPPRVLLELTECGHELVPIAGALARWGMRHQWSEPAGRERAGALALLHQLPVLLEGIELPSGRLEPIRVSADGVIRKCFRIEQGRLQALRDGDDDGFAERDGTPKRDSNGNTVCIEGDDRAWIAAFGPARDFAQLQFTGERRLGEHVLGALPASR
jgi:DNA-binding HxlR family transcriptional regulator